MLYGFSKIEEQLVHNFKNNKLHHCNLIVGRKGIGKSTFIKNFSSILLCENNANEFEDNNIRKAKKLIDSGGHTDLTILDINTIDDSGKENNSKKGEISIKQVRKIIDDVKLTSSISKNKVTIIDAIDQVNLNGQNALLKTLEEPTTNTYIFLVCHNINNVIETIKSRSNIIIVPDLSFDDWEKALFSLYELENSKLNNKDLYDISDHSVGLAIEFMKNNAVELYYKIIENISKEKKNVLEIQKLANFVSTNEIFEIFIKLFDKFFENLLKIHYSSNKIEEIISPYQENNLVSIAKNSKLIDIVKYYEYGKNLLNDISIYNLDRKHGVNILINEISLN